MSVKMRQELERRIVTAAIDQLLKAGYSLGVNDGEETTLQRSRDKKAILKAMFTTDEDWLLVYEAGNFKGENDWWVRFIYGNDGYDVMSDYCTALEEHLTEANKISEAEAMNGKSARNCLMNNQNILNGQDYGKSASVKGGGGTIQEGS